MNYEALRASRVNQKARIIYFALTHANASIAKKPKELPGVEQDARWTSFVARHPGKKFHSITRPSFELCNMAASMYSKNVLSYIPLARCTVESGGPYPSPWIDFLCRGDS